MPAKSSVCAVCLTADRPEMLKRAVSSFNSQTYVEKMLFVLDTSGSTESIGELRNRANNQAVGSTQDKPDGVIFNDPDIIIHWDDDDWSHPNRIAEQVALLQASDAEAVGYNEMLFWRKLPSVADTLSEASYRSTAGPIKGEAWLYRNSSPHYAVGTSLCYWRETWKKKPFQALPRKLPSGEMSGSEDREWIRGMKTEGASSLWECGFVKYDPRKPAPVKAPRMIASIHGGNSMPYNLEDLVARGATEWTRVPEWDDYCRKVMYL
jgi:hypothetical protein